MSLLQAAVRQKILKWSISHTFIYWKMTYCLQKGFTEVIVKRYCHKGVGETETINMLWLRISCQQSFLYPGNFMTVLIAYMIYTCKDVCKSKSKPTCFTLAVISFIFAGYCLTVMICLIGNSLITQLYWGSKRNLLRIMFTGKTVCVNSIQTRSWD